MDCRHLYGAQPRQVGGGGAPVSYRKISCGIYTKDTPKSFFLCGSLEYKYVQVLFDALVGEWSLTADPNYKEHQKKDFFAFAQKSVLIFAVAFILGITFINQLFNKPIQLLSYSIILLLNLNPKYKHYFCIYSKYFFS